MADGPIFDENALADAEKCALEEICRALGLRPANDGFVSVFPGRADCVVFDIGHLWIGDQVAFPANRFCFRGNLDLYSRSRPALQRWISRLMGSFPVAPSHGRRPAPYGGGRVEVLRIAPESSAIGQITTADVQLQSDRTTPVFTASVAFDVVFNTLPPEAAGVNPNIGG